MLKANKAQKSNGNLKSENNDTNVSVIPTKTTSPSQNILLNPNDLDSSPSCRICYNGSSKENLLRPCWCRGTIEYVHRNCLERWLETTNNQSCELCHYYFLTTRSRKSLWDWCREDDTKTDRRNAIGDLLCFLFLTPLGFMTVWMCTEGAIYYRKVNGSLEMVAMIGLVICLLLAYFSWIVLCVRYHFTIWFRWRDRHFNVRIIEQPNDRETRNTSDVAIDMHSNRIVEPLLPLKQQVVCIEPNEVSGMPENTTAPLLEQHYHLISRDGTGK
ncbi:E3 ubiquitin-protein ligase MARCHF3-like [Uloborus diversus]|uniref:E3 ubiquitin-protein ligase MARCHF3-like n=1 Tax=Uloborus diversus TaxID=327109 RepID=UPI0024098643|nr:E3 ubiquitin-protein ligase MARCHF3-like [Uloborus diversus]